MARRLVVRGFFGEVLSQIAIPGLRERLEAAIEAELAAIEHLNGARCLMATLEIRDLHVSVTTDEAPKEILKGVDLTIASGETHAIMGPNGSGKSTLAYSIAGHPKYDGHPGSSRSTARTCWR